MKRCLIFISLFFRLFPLSAQTLPIDSLTGEYEGDLGYPIICRVQPEGGKLILKIIGLGKIELIHTRANIYRLNGVKPEASIIFYADSLGKTARFRWEQKPSSFKWTKIAGDTGSSAGVDDYTGAYRMQDNPYRILHLGAVGANLQMTLPGQPPMLMIPQGKDHYAAKNDGQTYQLTFGEKPSPGTPGHDGEKSIVVGGFPPVNFKKRSSSIPHISNPVNGFTHADTLHGMLTPLRTCYDVLFYHLDITVTPETRFIDGRTLIRFKAMSTFDRIQVDLFANMHIESIAFHGRPLTYTRAYNAVFIQFPQPVEAGSQDELLITYKGHPDEPEIDVDKGGWLWLWDRDHRFWIETVTQGVGPSLWWPCKDHLSDRPDSMRISVTFPTGLSEISNGQLLKSTALPGGQTRNDWYVSYPINTYNVVVNIGHYAHFEDTCRNGQDSLALHFYCLAYNLPLAKKIFSQAKAMLHVYQQRFGPYPFPADGFTLMESLYPMEHQGAVSIGALNQPFNSTEYDSVNLVRAMWHESAHEWWGNSVGCRDYADMWIHESFATYAEVLMLEATQGRQAAMSYLHSQAPQNKEPIISVYDVNHFHMGDMYPKGALMLHTLRNILDDDDKWFFILKSIQERFKYHTISSKVLTTYISNLAGRDLSWFFDQYLRYPSPPTLLLEIKEEGPSLKIKYKWQANRPGFCMPVKWTTSKDTFELAYPTMGWQTVELKGMKRSDFRVDTDNFYFILKQT